MGIDALWYFATDGLKPVSLLYMKMNWPKRVKRGNHNLALLKQRMFLRRVRHSWCLYDYNMHHSG